MGDDHQRVNPDDDSGADSLGHLDPALVMPPLLHSPYQEPQQRRGWPAP